MDRENSETRNGAFILEVSATEISEQGSLGQTVTTEITIILEVRFKILSWLTRTFVLLIPGLGSGSYSLRIKLIPIGYPFKNLNLNLKPYLRCFYTFQNSKRKYYA